jgi:Clr5 domain
MDLQGLSEADETVVANHDALNQQEQVEHQSVNAEGRRSTPTSEEWLVYYPIFKQLYVVENMKLKDVQRTLEGQFGFIARCATFRP